MIDLHHAAARSSRASRFARSIASVMSLVVFGAAACSSDPAVDVPNPNGKDEGAKCVDDSECKSLVCTEGTCAPVSGGACGGAKCEDGDSCTRDENCKSGSCKGGKCAMPAPDDGVKNGDETDVDCGGSKAPKCGLDKSCAKNEDCASDACSYAKKCVAFKSCTGHFGGDTCGAGETGSPDAKHESCCATVKGKSGTAIGKYHVTAGRMRAFVGRYGGNLKAWAATSPKGWDPDWTEQLPGSMAEALDTLGPNAKRGCDPETKGARTYWQPPIDGDPARKSDFSQDVLDEKALNCVSWYMSQALCAFDGGRLATNDELVDLITNGGTTELPWEFQDTSSYDMSKQDERVVHRYSYHTPNAPKDMRLDGDGPLDRGFFIAPPGRRPAGANQKGAMDAVGNMLTWVNDKPRYLLYTVSWEEHGRKDRAEYWPAKDDGTDAYYAIGARCAYP